MRHPIGLIISVLTLTLLPLAVHAHTGVEYLNQLMLSQAFLAGVLHPLLGMDHLLVMLAIGFWAGLLRGKALWLLPGSFLTMMTIGAGLQMSGIALAAAEVWVMLSVLVCGLGLFWAHQQHPVSLLVSLMTSVLAVGHGYVHAAEATGDFSLYAAGFLLMTALLHGLGILFSLFAGYKLNRLRQSFAIICTLTGAALLIAL